MPEEKKERAGLGFLGWTILLALALVGGWVLINNALEWARPWWRYVSVASIAFTIGTFYGRYRKDQAAAKKKNKQQPF